MKKPIRTALVIGVLSASPLSVANTFCATDAQRTAIQAAMADPAKPAPYRVAAKLSVPEATVQSALSPASYGIHASQFRSVWTSLTNWEEAVTVVMKGGHIFETHGRIPEGEPSKRSQFFNLKSKAEGMHGHLRPDLLSRSQPSSQRLRALSCGDVHLVRAARGTASNPCCRHR